MHLTTSIRFRPASRRPQGHAVIVRAPVSAIWTRCYLGRSSRGARHAIAHPPTTGEM